MVELRLINKPHLSVAEEPALVPGRPYRLATASDNCLLRHSCVDPDLLIGDYLVTPEQARFVTADPTKGATIGYLWDPELTADQLRELPLRETARRAAGGGLQGNRLQLHTAGLDGPELHVDETGTCLRMHAHFALQWRTDVCAASLASVTLVQASRSLRFEDGGEMCLLDTAGQDGGVRYAPPADDDGPLRAIAGPQGRGEVSEQVCSIELTQAIPAQIDGRLVAEVTVLERYSSYFMQRELAQQKEVGIWVPLMTPLMWGWSIRVGRRTDGEWGILRRKLFLPTGQEEGFSLPLWESHTGLLTRPL